MFTSTARYSTLSYAIALLVIFRVIPVENDHISRLLTRPSSQQRNTPPTVIIKEPAHNAVYPANALVKYSVEVSDKEDGESRYDEIASDRIFLELTAIENSSKSNDRPRDTAIDRHGLTLMMRSDCFNCHQFRSRNIGPSFSQIALKYDRHREAETIAMRIKKGSTGLWGEEIMPAHPDLSDEETINIAEWILTYGRVENLDYVKGKSGTFRTTLPAGQSSGSFLITAMYTDNGVSGNEDILTGYDSIIVHCR